MKVPRKKGPKNRFCRRSKLSEGEFCGILWYFVQGTAAAKAARLLAEENIRVSERTIWALYGRLGRYLFERQAAMFLHDRGEIPRPEPGFKLDPDKYREHWEAYNNIYDDALRRVDRNTFKTLRDVGAHAESLLVSGLRDMSANKRGITRSKAEHVALSFYANRALKTAAKNKIPIESVNDVHKIAFEILRESLMLDPL